MTHATCEQMHISSARTPVFLLKESKKIKLKEGVRICYFESLTVASLSCLRRTRFGIARRSLHGNETKNRVLSHHHESANILCAEPVCRPLDAGFRSYCRDVSALPPQNAFDGHRPLPSCWRSRLSHLAPTIGGIPWNPCSSTRNISISHRQEAVAERCSPSNR
jgi:hypothetical protein